MAFEMQKDTPVSLADLAAGWTGPRPPVDPPRHQDAPTEPARRAQGPEAPFPQDWPQDELAQGVAPLPRLGPPLDAPHIDGFELGDGWVVGFLGGEAFDVPPVIGAQIAELLIFVHASHMQQRYADYGARFGLRGIEGQGEALPEAESVERSMLDLSGAQPEEDAGAAGKSVAAS